LGSARVFFNETAVPCMSEYHAYLSVPQANQVLDVTWLLYIDAIKTATSTGGFNALASNWAICEEKAAEYGKPADRNRWRLVGPMHIAESREQARKDVRHGLEAWLDFSAASPLAAGAVVRSMTPLTP
jgi:hypothetical protein